MHLLATDFILARACFSRVHSCSRESRRIARDLQEQEQEQEQEEVKEQEQEKEKKKEQPPGIQVLCRHDEHTLRTDPVLCWGVRQLDTS